MTIKGQSLEDRIKELLEGTITVSGDNLSVTHEEGDVSSDEENGGDDQDQSDNGKTDVANDQGQQIPDEKDKANVKEETSVPGLGKSLSGEGPTPSAESDNAKLTAGKGKKDGGGGGASKLADPGASADAKPDDGGDNAKIEAGKSKGDKAPQKLAVKEHIDAMFAGQNLSEEFKSKATVIFETAVEHAAADRVAQLQEEYEQKLEEASNEIVEATEEKFMHLIDEYLNEAVEVWIDENKVAIERGLRTEMFDSLVDGLKGVLESHYVEVPDEGIDVVAEQATRIEELTSTLSDAAEELAITKSKLQLEQCTSIVNEKSKSLTDVDKDKFKSLCEKIDFDSVEDFGVKAQTILEMYFQGKLLDQPAQPTKPLIESVDADAPKVHKLDEKELEMYAAALSKGSIY